jgi:hypothetical protein
LLSDLQGAAGASAEAEVKPNIGSAIQSVTSDNNQAQSNSQFVNNGPSYASSNRPSGGGSGSGGAGGPGEDDVVYLSELNWVSLFIAGSSLLKITYLLWPSCSRPYSGPTTNTSEKQPPKLDSKSGSTIRHFLSTRSTENRKVSPGYTVTPLRTHKLSRLGSSTSTRNPISQI